MKKTILFILIACLSLAVCGGAAFAEASPEELTAEELYEIGAAAAKEEDWEKSLK